MPPTGLPVDYVTLSGAYNNVGRDVTCSAISRTRKFRRNMDGPGAPEQDTRTRDREGGQW